MTFSSNSIVPILILLASVNVINGGILSPQASESRELLTLDGLWQFTTADRSQQNQGFVEKWFEKSLNEVFQFKDGKIDVFRGDFLDGLL